MRSARRCRSTHSSSGAATPSRPAVGSLLETLTACRSARRKSWISWRSIRFGISARERARGQQAGILVGIGVACASKNYGTGGDTVLGSVEITPDGLITIRCDATEIGNAVGRGAANRIAPDLGGGAEE